MSIVAIGQKQPQSLSGVEKDIKDLKAEQTTQNTNITNIQNDIQLIQADVNDVEQINAQQETKITALQNKDTQQDISIANNANEISTIKQEQVTQNNNITTHTNDIAGIHVKNTEQDNKITALETSQAAQDATIAQLSTQASANTNKNVEQDARILALEQKPTGQVVTAHFHTYSIKNDLGYTWVKTDGDGNNRGFTWQSRITLKPLPNGIQPTHNNVMGLRFSGVPDVVRCFYWETATTIMVTMRKNTRVTDDYRNFMDVMNIQITVLSGGNFRMVTSGLDFDEQKLYIGGND